MFYLGYLIQSLSQPDVTGPAAIRNPGLEWLRDWPNVTVLGVTQTALKPQLSDCKSHALITPIY